VSERSERAPAEPDDVLAGLIHRADLDGLVRLVDDCCATRDWARLRRLRDEARYALGTGRQLWPAATLAEYRLALLAPAPWAAGVLDEGSGRFTIGPLTEVVAQDHTWAELAPLLEPGPRAAIVAHERALRFEPIDPASTSGLPDVLELPYALAEWEPAYALATYTDDGVQFPSPAGPGPFADVALPVEALARLDDDDTVELAVRQLVESWTATSNGRAEVVAVEGGAGDAVRALGVHQARLASMEPAAAVAWLAWAGASGGAHGRRRGAAAGRFGALWVVGALVDVLDDWPLPLDELGAIAADLRWWWWDALEPATGWQLQLAVEDPDDGLAWAISARDAV
jgi:resuscitation-promoting factor RpfA